VSGTGALWVFFVTGALSVAFALGALLVFFLLAQRKAMARERQYARDLLQAQEAERAWIAREVHDDAVQRLAVIANELSNVLPHAVQGIGSNRVSGIVGEVQDLGVSLRNLAHGLHPSAIDKGGIIPALHQLATDFNTSSGFIVDLVINDPPRLSRDAELAIYRIAQESLRNVARHAGVARATVRRGRHNGHAVLEVIDQGSGLVPLAARTGIGLRSMQERALLAGGTCRIESRPGIGTTVLARVPERTGSDG
jgi:signal transduction histidine kinase